MSQSPPPSKSFLTSSTVTRFPFAIDMPSGRPRSAAPSLNASRKTASLALVRYAFSCRLNVVPGFTADGAKHEKTTGSRPPPAPMDRWRRRGRGAGAGGTARVFPPCRDMFPAIEVLSDDTDVLSGGSRLGTIWRGRVPENPGSMPVTSDPVVVRDSDGSSCCCRGRTDGYRVSESLSTGASKRPLPSRESAGMAE